jgi:hypothetical protein
MVSILVTGFNRPDLLDKCFTSILNQGLPCEIFVHLDGPRNLEEIVFTQQCLDITSNLKHPNLHFLECEFHAENLGCKEAMWCALDWFFSHRSKGLIIEDDVIVLPGALLATSILLDKFEFDKSICQISLSNQIARVNRPDVSYSLSNYPFIWGWATWKDRWDSNIKDIAEHLSSFTGTEQAKVIKSQIGRRAFGYWLKRFEKASRGQIDTWDFQWHFTNWHYGRKSIHLNRIFAVNIGFDHRATHTQVALKRDLINLKKLTDVRNQDLHIREQKFSCISITDRRISSRVFGIPHWLFHPLKFGKTHFLDHLAKLISK